MRLAKVSLEHNIENELLCSPARLLTWLIDAKVIKQKIDNVSNWTGQFKMTFYLVSLPLKSFIGNYVIVYDCAW